MPDLDTRHPLATLVGKDNILPNDYPAVQYSPLVLYVEGTDAATGASGVVTVDGGVGFGAADTGPLSVGTYALYAEIQHPSAAAANREVQVQHRDAANAANLAVYKTVAAGAGTAKQIVRRLFIVETANERVRLLTGSDATNANIAVKVLVAKID